MTERLAFAALEPGRRFVIVPQQGAVASAAALVAHCRERIASYKKPRYVRYVDSLPRIHNGKIDKIALRAIARAAIGAERHDYG